MGTLSALLAICAGNSPVPGEFPAQRPVTRSFGVFFDLCLNKRLSKQSWGWWFETLSRPLWRHCNVMRKLENTGPATGVYISSNQESWHANVHIVYFKTVPGFVVIQFTSWPNVIKKRTFVEENWSLFKLYHISKNAVSGLHIEKKTFAQTKKNTKSGVAFRNSMWKCEIKCFYQKR